MEKESKTISTRLSMETYNDLMSAPKLNEMSVSKYLAYLIRRDNAKRRRARKRALK